MRRMRARRDDCRHGIISRLRCFLRARSVAPTLRVARGLALVHLEDARGKKPNLRKGPDV